ncbi:cytochrome c [Chitinophaga costaii]|uniref:Cytochrome c n=1 Tax=Chitinophaga costaii TaxID=1335309 RepID=A0A1C4FTI5_9BACT|nr:ThuA domain-containing protein [Chitinophaga costaii]PUZ27204.1 ThuA domain-containing protein [Chitinophaga costaii]SCC59317.1 cytochrome c [Chitinophaga costaii]
MKKIIFCCFLWTLGAHAQTPRVLVFSKTLRYHHVSIAAGNVAIQRLGLENGFQVDTTTNAAYFTEDSLRHYAAVIFLSTTGNVLDTAQQADLERYIQAGGGYVGIHSASATETDWPWYGHLVGAVFNGHPPQPVPGTVVVAAVNHPATLGMPLRWQRTDEWYNFRNRIDSLQVLLLADETTYAGGTNGTYHPLAWYHNYDGGRSFYTALGHLPEHYQDSLFLHHVLVGIQYAIGQNHLDYGKAYTKRILQ